MISYPELVSFHFFIPGGNEDKVPFYKLKVLFPHSNLEIHGQEEVKEIARTGFSDEQYAKPSYKEIVPFIIPTVHQFLGKSIYVSPNVIIKARVEEELIGVVLDNYAIATAQVCSQRLKTRVNSDVLDALKALNLRERTDRKNPAVALALHSRYFKLSSSSSMVKDITSSEVNSIMIIYYDGPKTSCMKSICGAALEYSHGNVLTQYLYFFLDDKETSLPESALCGPRKVSKTPAVPGSYRGLYVFGALASSNPALALARARPCGQATPPGDLK